MTGLDGAAPATRLDGVRVAVTGASGFCGRAVALAAAAAGADVTCVSRRPGPVGRHVVWDAGLDRPELDGADVVVHLAAAVGDTLSPVRAQAVNVRGGARLLEAAGGRRVVWVSSASVYRHVPGRRVVREGDPVGGNGDVYGATKAAGDTLALAAGAVVLRPRAVYGPGDPHLVPRLLRAARRGWLPLPGADGPMSLTAVENLADACLAAVDWPPGAYNVADAEPYPRDATLLRVLAAHGRRARVCPVPLAAARTAAALTGRATGLTPYAVEQLAHGVVLDLSRAGDQGWRPARTLADHLTGLRAVDEEGILLARRG